jgi:ATP-binding cassette subfamily B protein RaxB
MIAGAVAPESRLGFGWRRRLALILQSEAVECGLACLAMVAGWHGYRTDLPTLRRRFSISLKGATLKQLIDIAGQLNFAARPLRLELDELAELKTPCILHWDLNHFVVLVRAGKRHIAILDPAHTVRAAAARDRGTRGRRRPPLRSRQEQQDHRARAWHQPAYGSRSRFRAAS